MLHFSGGRRFATASSERLKRDDTLILRLESSKVRTIVRISIARLIGRLTNVDAPAELVWALSPKSLATSKSLDV